MANLILFVKIFFFLAGLVILESAVASTAVSAQFSGRPVCATCHAEQASQWSGSHHDLAMQPATEKTVLGNFDHASLAHFGVTTSFFMKAGKFMVRAENPVFSPAYVNLADLYRSQGKEAEAGKVLSDAIKVIPESADVHHALGLSLIRQKHADEAVEELRLASTLNPDNAHYVYVYAVALNSTGKPEQAIMVLQGAHTAHPNNVEILNALVAFHRDMGNQSAARTYAEKLRGISP